DIAIIVATGQNSSSPMDHTFAYHVHHHMIS
ncbi:unnamed protein product, partial [marine sediment metagenome]